MVKRFLSGFSVLLLLSMMMHSQNCCAQVKTFSVKSSTTKTEKVASKGTSMKGNPPVEKKKNDPVYKTGQTGLKPRKEASVTKILHNQQWALDNIQKNMVRIEGGVLKMGVAVEGGQGATDDNTPLHEVKLSPYYICKYEVTEEEWQLVMGDNPSDKSNGMMVSSSCPVDNISWMDCQEFVKKLTQLTGIPFRLPTEAEWEFAARGGEEDPSVQYAGKSEIEDCGWYVGNSSRIKHPVGTKGANSYGLYDMTGNVREWVKDFYEKDYYSRSPEQDPQGPSKGDRHVVRGGSFNNQDDACAVTYRSYAAPDSKNKFTGLRLAYSAD